MNLLSIPSNPFALLLAPEAVIAQIAASKHLAMLNSRVCRPLDKPMLEQEGDEEGLGNSHSSSGQTAED